MAAKNRSSTRRNGQSGYNNTIVNSPVFRRSSSSSSICCHRSPYEDMDHMTDNWVTSWRCRRSGASPIGGYANNWAQENLHSNRFNSTFSPEPRPESPSVSSSIGGRIQTQGSAMPTLHRPLSGRLSSVSSSMGGPADTPGTAMFNPNRSPPLRRLSSLSPFTRGGHASSAPGMPIPSMTQHRRQSSCVGEIMAANNRSSTRRNGQSGYNNTIVNSPVFRRSSSSSSICCHRSPYEDMDHMTDNWVTSWRCRRSGASPIGGYANNWAQENLHSNRFNSTFSPEPRPESPSVSSSIGGRIRTQGSAMPTLHRPLSGRLSSVSSSMGGPADTPGTAMFNPNRTPPLRRLSSLSPFTRGGHASSAPGMPIPSMTQHRRQSSCVGLGSQRSRASTLSDFMGDRLEIHTTRENDDLNCQDYTQNNSLSHQLGDNVDRNYPHYDDSIRSLASQNRYQFGFATFYKADSPLDTGVHNFDAYRIL